FGTLVELFHGQHAMGINQVIGVAHQSLELFLHVAAQRSGDFDMMTGDAQLHGASPYFFIVLHLSQKPFGPRYPLKFSWPPAGARWRAQFLKPPGTWRLCGGPPARPRWPKAPRSGHHSRGWMDPPRAPAF